ncbi:MAG: hypothetical protein R2710_20575 [Acidimicrobiales bacterium]
MASGVPHGLGRPTGTGHLDRASELGDQATHGELVVDHLEIEGCCRLGEHRERGGRRLLGGGAAEGW